mgnify:CR=1 FL=1
MNMIPLRIVTFALALAMAAPSFGEGYYSANRASIEQIAVVDSSEASKLGVEVSVLHANRKSFHPDGVLNFLLSVTRKENEGLGCSIDYKIVVHSDEYDEIVSESLEMHSGSPLSREYSLQKPNAMKLYIVMPRRFRDCSGAVDKTKIYSIDIGKIVESEIAKEVSRDALDNR